MEEKSKFKDDINYPPKPEKHHRRHVKHILLVGIIAILLLATAYGASLLLTQNAPSVTATAPVIAATCANMSAQNITTNSVVFDCGTATPAFGVTNGPLSTTPNIVTQSCTSCSTYLTIGIVPSMQNVCGGAGFQSIMNGQISIASGHYNYCATFTPPPSNGQSTFAAFTVNWT